MILKFRSQQEKDSASVRTYLATHKTDLYTLFACAYHSYYGLLDKFEVKATIERFETSGFTPVYVREYLHKLN